LVYPRYTTGHEKTKSDQEALRQVLTAKQFAKAEGLTKEWLRTSYIVADNINPKIQNY
jgi:cytochrome oxidase assembly protein ShyY1